jgi:hypothetical protein
MKLMIFLILSLLLLAQNPLPQDACPPGYVRAVHVHPSGLHVFYCKRSEG